MQPVFSAPPAAAAEFDGGWRWWLNVWLPVAIAMAVIATESTGTFSAQNTSGWLRPVFESVLGRLSDTGWELFHHYLRKTGHFVGYGTVGFTFLRAWLYTRARGGVSSLRAWRAECTVLAILSTASVASIDEFHQTFIPGRTGTPVDVLLDTCGASAMCLAVWLIFWRRGAAGQQPWESSDG